LLLAMAVRWVPCVAEERGEVARQWTEVTPGGQPATAPRASDEGRVWKARLLYDRRVAVSETAFAELVLWEVPAPGRGSAHNYRYRLAFVVREVCVLRYDNEAGMGDHVHRGERERSDHFTNPDRLVAKREGKIHNPAQDTKKQGALGATSNQSSRGLPYLLCASVSLW
jgi:hypothetical protein